MRKTRLILFALSLALGYGHFWLYMDSPISDVPLRIVLHTVGGILWLAASAILFFSFLKVDKADDGSLCYDPANPYWKFMKWVYEDKWSDRISLCKSYWFTVGVLLIGVFFAIVLAGVGFLVYMLVDTIHDGKVMELLAAVGMAVGGVLLIVGLLLSIFYLWDKFRWFRYASLALLCVGAVFFFPYFSERVVYVATNTQKESVVAGFKAVGIIFGAMVAAVILIVGAFKLIPFLQNTWLGFYLSKAKKFMCPDLVACPCRVQQS